MCGIAGFIDGCSGVPFEGWGDMLRRMGDALKHRGPDDSGVWIDKECGVGLAHRRLSIIDLSSEGHQPMASASGRYQVVYNGEIYNHPEIRGELEREGLLLRGWRGHSDTETLLAAIEAWGVEKALQKSVGMFALALWDRKEKTLTLARDRMGEKPLYYGFLGGAFVFASELKALRAHEAFSGEIDRGALCLYLRHCYIPAPHSIYRGVWKLMPGTFLEVPASGALDPERSRVRAYWSLTEVAARGNKHPFAGDEADAVAALDGALRQAVSLQMMSDVPLGAFLSGGVDSSTVVSLMQAQSSQPVRTFSIGSDHKTYNEAGFAKAVAKHLGTEHTEHYVAPAEAMMVIPRLGRMYDEPFADSSQIPTFLVSAMARQHVTVSLSGDGGDELFCGYNRYLKADAWRRVSLVPYPIRKGVGAAMRVLGLPVCDALGSLPLFQGMHGRLARASWRLEKVKSAEDFYHSLVSELALPEKVVLGATEPGYWLTETGLKSRFPDPKLQMMYLDCMTYLHDDILAKVDRAAMSTSLETRVPLLDHRVVELAWSLPLSMKYRKGQTKWILRQVLYKYVPKDLIERPKKGFSIPFGPWLRGPLKDWVEGMLDESRLRRQEFFDVPFVRGLWKEHLRHNGNAQNLLWAVLMFQVWLEEHKRS